MGAVLKAADAMGVKVTQRIYRELYYHIGTDVSELPYVHTSTGAAPALAPAPAPLLPTRRGWSDQTWHLEYICHYFLP